MWLLLLANLLQTDEPHSCLPWGLPCWFQFGVWVRSCETTLLFWVNRWGHIEQPYGFSPVWVRSCETTVPFWANRVGHIEQAYGFSPV